MPSDLLHVGVKWPILFASLTGNMVPVVMLHQIATAKDAESQFESDPDVLVSSTGVKGKRKRYPPFPMPEPLTESSHFNPHGPVSSTGVILGTR